MHTNPAIHDPTTTRSFVDILRRHADRAGEHLAFAFCNRAGEVQTQLDHATLDRTAREIATRLEEQAPAGERALLMFPPGIDFVTAFFGCLYAGTIAVPVYPPQSLGEATRLVGIVERAAPRAIVSTHDFFERIAPLLSAVPSLASLPRIAIAPRGTAMAPRGNEMAPRGNEITPRGNEINGPASADAWRRPTITGDTIAFLQFTSGSTGRPRGVVVTHGNLLANQAVIQERMGHGDHTVFAGWLPVYHDMGLIGNVLQSAYLGVPCYLLSPIDFIRRPATWLEMISRYRATTSGGPSFAYDLCARRVTPEQAAGLDLSSWEVAFNGAEPVRADVLDRFTARFQSNGFRRTACYPCYGLAEGTLMVTGPAKADVPLIAVPRGAVAVPRGAVAVPRGAVAVPRGAIPVPRGAIVRVDRQALVGGHLVPSDAEDAQALVGCGRAGDEHEVAIVDRETGTRLPSGHVGEIWVRGASVARGYWNDPKATADTFGGRLDAHDDYLRTGDAGFVDEHGELFIVGRFKDVIIVRGRNHYPDDIERTAEAACSILRPGRGVAFGVDRDGEERVVVVYELSRGDHGDTAPLEIARVMGDVTEAVAARHGLCVHAVVLVRPGSVPKTSSGKPRRSACRALYLEERLELVKNG